MENKKLSLKIFLMIIIFISMFFVIGREVFADIDEDTKYRIISKEIDLTYELFGAAGDGKTDDSEAIRAAHDFANNLYKNNDIKLTVKGTKDAAYYIGVLPTTISVYTDVDWNGCTFIIDDYIDENNDGINDVNTGLSVFTVSSKYSPLNLGTPSCEIEINTQTKDLSSLIDYFKMVTAADLKANGGINTGDGYLNTTRQNLLNCDELLIEVQNSNLKQFIRKGKNENDGTNQQDYFLIDVEGNVLQDIIWDFDDITKIAVYPVDKTSISLKNAKFISYTDNNMYNESGVLTGYKNRNILIKRSNVEIDNIVHILDESKHESKVPKTIQSNSQANLYLGFLKTDFVANLTVKNSKFMPHQSTNSAGTYDLSIGRALRVSFENVGYSCACDDCNSNEDVNIYCGYNCDCECRDCYRKYIANVDERWLRWGISATNFVKDVTFENCKLNRIDSHQGVWNLTVKDSIVGQYGFTLIGGGTFTADNVTIDGSSYIVSLRGDYGSTWNGTMILKDIDYIVPPMYLKLIDYSNDGTWNFGYKCYYPNIIIQNLYIDDRAASPNISLVPIYETNVAARNFPYIFSDYIIVKNIKRLSGKKFLVFPSTDYINQSLYGSGTKTKISVYDTELNVADVGIYNTNESQFIVTKDAMPTITFETDGYDFD